jgi:hypothetical protein
MSMPEFIKKKIAGSDSSSSDSGSDIESSSSDSGSDTESSSANEKTAKKSGGKAGAGSDNPLMKWATKRGQ